MCEKCNCGGCNGNPKKINLSIKDITSKFAETLVFDNINSVPNNMEVILKRLHNQLTVIYNINFFIEFDCDSLLKTISYCLSDMEEFIELNSNNSSLRYNNLYISQTMKLRYKYTDYLLYSFVSNVFNKDVLI